MNCLNRFNTDTKDETAAKLPCTGLERLSTPTKALVAAIVPIKASDDSLDKLPVIDEIVAK